MFSVQDLLNRASAVKRPDECRISVVTHSPGRLGGTPGVDIKAVNIGFDWNAGRLLLVPEHHVIEVDSTEAEVITEEARKVNSPAGYQMWKRIQRLEQQLKDNGIEPEK